MISILRHSNQKIVLRGFNVLPKLFGSVRNFNVITDDWTPDSLKEIEKQWQPQLKEEVARRLPSDTGQKPCYVLSMFPYPSGQLHMGHVRVYTISDSIANYYRMQGKTVIHPMGWDAFGLPAENAAIERNIDPKTWTKDNIASMKQQLDKLGCLFDWDRELSTCDPEYYKWTQYLFLKLMEHNLAYQYESMVNWDPVDKTVLADEQVDAKGCSWRSGAKVEKRPLKQWFLKTTNFSKDLYDNLDDPSLKNWRDITSIQRHWIGDCNGSNFTFAYGPGPTDFVQVWTDKPELIFGASFVCLGQDHLLAKKDVKVKREFLCKTLESQVKELDLTLRHPFANQDVSVFVIDKDAASIDLFPPGNNVLLGIPSGNSTHFKLAQELGVTVNEVLSPDQQTLINSDSLTGKSLAEARSSILSLARRKGIGGYLTSSKLRDWLVSRQRYWGTPIPVIHCQTCGPVPVPENELPVLLPDLDSLSLAGGGSPLSQAEDWVNVTCPKCGSDAKRETDTMDTFVDSSWYFLRYLDPKNNEAPAGPDAAKGLPVDIYIGGKEHAMLHMYFARFFTHFMHSIGLSPVKEPFQSLLTQGMVKGKSYRLKGTGKYLRPEAVQVRLDQSQKKAREVATEISSGKDVVVEWEKMSKSKYNGVDPNLILDKYGCDTTRMMILCDVGPASDRNWTEDTYNRIRNMQIRLCKLVSLAVKLQHETLAEMDEDTLKKARLKLWDDRNYYLSYANYSYDFGHNLHIVIARVQSFLQDLWSAPGQLKRDCVEFQRGLATCILLLTPMAPHFCAHLWQALSQVKINHCADEFDFTKSVFCQPWPQLDENYNLKLYINDRDFELTIIPVAKWKFATLTKEEAFDLACHEPTVQQKVLPKEFVYDFDKIDNFKATLTFKPQFTKESFQEMLSEKKRIKEEKLKRKEERRARAAKQEAKKACRERKEI